MGSVEWNKKEELVAEQALKHLKVWNNAELIFYCYSTGYYGVIV